MKVVLIGSDRPGKVTQALAEFDYEMGFEAVKGALAVNTAEADLRGFRHRHGPSSARTGSRATASAATTSSAPKSCRRTPRK